MTTSESRTGQVLPRNVLQQFERAVEGADNPVAAVRALRRVASRLPARYQGQRDVVRWEAEQALRPFFREITGARAAKAAVWAALDGVWDRSDTPADAPVPEQGAARQNDVTAKIATARARVREAMSR